VPGTHAPSLDDGCSVDMSSVAFQRSSENLKFNIEGSEKARAFVPTVLPDRDTIRSKNMQHLAAAHTSWWSLKTILEVLPFRGPNTNLNLFSTHVEIFVEISP
jgi:hypothetical protein